MCGIAGWFTKFNIENSESRLLAMSKAIAHRGPDGSGFWISDQVAMAHTRLAIIGLENGAQPMLSQCGNVSISFNGEIYNYKALKKGLLSEGFSFQSDTDTEVIINLYLKYGVESFGKLRGMYAFSLWDKRNRTGYLVRDPNGIKPLFYKNEAGKCLAFGSEAKAILSLEKARVGINFSALHKLLNFRYIPDESSLFEGIYQLAPGTILTWKDGSVRQQSVKAEFPYSSDSNLNHLLLESVEAHLTSDVEVGAYLSGGIDSALITAIAQRLTGNRIRTFTLNAGDDPREAENARETAEELKLDNYLGEIQGKAGADFIKLIWHLEVPKINAFQVDQLARHTSKYVKVALSGLGADELFLGYNAHKWMERASWARKYFSRPISLFGTAGVWLNTQLSGGFWSERERALFIAKYINKSPVVYGLMRNVWDSPSARQKIYGPRMLDQELPPIFEWLESKWPQNTSDPLISMRSFEWDRKMVNDLLWQEDRCSMAHGLEVRVPYVDSVVKSRLWNMSGRELMPNREKKALLKNVAREYLSESILNRKKSGFQVDAPVFFRQELRVLAERYLAPKVIKNRGLFNPEFVNEVLKMNPRKAHRWHYFMLYLILGMHVWLDIFEDNEHAF